jgi:4-hydroxybenzoate polyprenyltransferase
MQTSLRAWLAFLRFPNLLIVAATQYLMRYCTLYLFTDAPVFTEIDFLVMVLGTMTVAAGGYIINDLYDYPIDRLNKPHKTFINSLITERNAYRLYALTCLLVVLVGVYFYARTGWRASYFYPLVGISMLWLYSFWLKKTVLWGNLTVALFCAFVPYMVYVPQATVAFPEYELLRNFQVATSDALYNVFALYAAFAFLSTLFREIVKDIEDKDGDAVYGCRTLPIVFGVRVAKIVAGLTGVGLLLFMAWVMRWEWQLGSALRFGYALLLLVLPLFYTLFRLVAATDKAAFHHISQVIKGIMLAGLLYLVVFYWTSI